MSLRKKEYINRLVDKKIEEYLSVFGAVSICLLYTSPSPRD